jgi:hypothetical protein
MFMIERVTGLRFLKDGIHTDYKIEKTKPAAAAATQRAGSSYTHEDIPDGSHSRSRRSGSWKKKIESWMKAIFRKESFEESTSHLFHQSQILMMMMVKVVTMILRSSHKDRQLSGRRHFMTTNIGLPHRDAPCALHARPPQHTVRGVDISTSTRTRSEFTSLLFSSLFGT